MTDPDARPAGTAARPGPIPDLTPALPDPAAAPGAFLRALFTLAVAAADPMRVIPRHLPQRPQGRVVVVGAGKASARMAEAVEEVWGPCTGLVVTRDGYARPCAGIEIALASHPVPDARGAKAARRMLDLLAPLGAEDTVLALISGGASALLTAPAEGLSLADKQAVNAALLASGAPIGQMNLLRKHLSRVKGGRLAAAAHPARVLSLLISDVPGDDPAVIGSGPTVGEASTPGQARAVLDRWGDKLDTEVAARVRAVLDRAAADRAAAEPDVGAADLGGRDLGGRDLGGRDVGRRAAGGGVAGTVPSGDPRLARAEARVIAAPSLSLAAAADAARAAGCTVELLGDALEGEARDVAAAQARLALERRRDGRAVPHLILSGGELTVTRRGRGTGGPNAEFCLALAQALDAAPGIHAIACDTDGVDGAAEIAGAVIDPTSCARARSAGHDPAAALADNDSHAFFTAIGDSVVTGPTLTNVNDFRAILILPQPG